MSNDDDELFRRAMADAKPIRTSERVPPRRRRPPPKARFSRDDERAVLAESLESDIDEVQAFSGDALRYRHPSVGRRTMRRLARGGYAVQAELDLHGMTVAEAKPRLAGFIDDCVARGLRCVRVVHGKGLGSGSRGPVLKGNVDAWLRRWSAVLAFVSTRQVDGGTGAVYVLLKER